MTQSIASLSWVHTCFLPTLSLDHLSLPGGLSKQTFAYIPDMFDLSYLKPYAALKQHPRALTSTHCPAHLLLLSFSDRQQKLTVSSVSISLFLLPVHNTESGTLIV